MLAHYDAENNTGTGHSNTATEWKDLTGNGNDMTLVGFDNTTESGWQETTLMFDGINDYGKTNNQVDYKSTKQLTIHFTEIGGKLLETENTSIVLEASENANNLNGAFYVSYNQFGQYTQDLFIKGATSSNVKSMTNMLEINKHINTYVFVIDTTKTYDNFIEMYINGEKQDIQSQDSYKEDISNFTIPNSILNLGSRNGTESFTKMQLANLKIYSKALTQEEIQMNYWIDEYRF